MTDPIILADLDSERALIGSVLISPDAYQECGFLTADDFHAIQNRAIWTAIGELVADNQAVDLITLSEKLKGEASISELSRLADIPPSSLNAPSYAKTVRDYAIRRSLVQAASKTARAAYNMDASAQEAAQESLSAVNAVAEGAPTHKTVRHVKDWLQEYDDDRVRGFKGQSFHIRSYDQNRLLGGIWLGRVVLIIGQAKTGKSLLVDQWAGELAEQTGVFLVAQDMPARDILTRDISARAKIDEARLQAGGDLGEDYPRYLEAIENLSLRNLHISGESSWGIDDLRAKTRQLKRESNVQLVIVDMLKQIANPPRVESEYEALVWKLSELKSLAKDMDVAVIAVHELVLSGTMRGGAGMDYGVDLSLKLMSDADYRAERARKLDPILLARDKLDNVRWLTEDKRRYGGFQPPAELIVHPAFPFIGDAMKARSA